MYSNSSNILRIKSNAGQLLYFFGAKHTNDVNDEQFKNLITFWNEFVENSKNTRIILIEKNIKNKPLSYDESIKNHGESGAIYWLGMNEKILCPEPTDEEQRNDLIKLFDPETVAYALIVQNLSAWFRYKKNSNFYDALDRTVERESKFNEIYKFTLDVNWFQRHHSKLFNKQVIDDKNFLDSISDPRNNNTIVNSVISNRTRIRNEYIKNKIQSEWNSGKSIFIVYGMGHLDSLKSFLNSIV